MQRLSMSRRASSWFRVAATATEAAIAVSHAFSTFIQYILIHPSLPWINIPWGGGEPPSSQAEPGFQKAHTHNIAHWV